MVTFLKEEAGLFSKYLMTYIPMHPTTIAVVVAIAGIILPAMSFILKLSISWIL
jgi:hypothetical protein